MRLSWPPHLDAKVSKGPPGRRTRRRRRADGSPPSQNGYGFLAFAAGACCCTSLGDWVVSGDVLAIFAGSRWVGVDDDEDKDNVRRALLRPGQAEQPVWTDWWEGREQELRGSNAASAKSGWPENAPPDRRSADRPGVPGFLLDSEVK